MKAQSFRTYSLRSYSLRQRLAYFTIATATVVMTACSPAGSMAAPAAEAPASGGAPYSYAAAPAAQEMAVGEAATGMFFQNYGVNGFVDTAQDNLSTFGVDVDTGAYTLARSYITNGNLPPQDAVRVEEFVNFFDYHYALPTAEQTFAIDMEGAISPFADGANSRVLRVGIQGYDIAPEDRKDAALTFVIDVSGSMNMDNRLGFVKRSLTKMVEELRPTDSVGIVVYGSSARTVLPPTLLSEKQKVLDGINALNPDGSTNAAEGIALGYEEAWKHFREGALNRVILCSDGVANVGITEPGGILDTVKQYAAKGIYMTSVGVGMGNFNRRVDGTTGRQRRWLLHLRGQRQTGRQTLPARPHRHTANHRQRCQDSGRVQPRNRRTLPLDRLRES